MDTLAKKEDFKVIDLGNDSDEGDHMYFLAKVQGKYFVDPFEPVQDLFINDSSADECERDSQDSNRESADQNDYPDEEQMHDSDGHSKESFDSDQPKPTKISAQG